MAGQDSAQKRKGQGVVPLTQRAMPAALLSPAKGAKSSAESVVGPFMHDDANLPKPSRVWNRACFADDNASLRSGDRALSDLLRVHGSIMNGGVYHALDCHPRAELDAAAAGYRFFGFEEVASLIQGLPDASEEELDRAEDQYGEFVPDDSTLVDRFEAIYVSAPDSFAPIDP